ncbi:hypothetical protein BC940DRAFT_310098 [Gongronella butleri]|nr:hypothetical protein BC940DRAFT_310098 [Gongronella butleri]
MHFKKATTDGIKLAPPIRALSVLTFERPDDSHKALYIIKVTPQPLTGDAFARQRKSYLIARRFEQFATLDQQLHARFTPSMSSTLLTALRRSRSDHVHSHHHDESSDGGDDGHASHQHNKLPRLRRQRSKVLNKEKPSLRQRQFDLNQYCQELLDQDASVKDSALVLEFFGQHKADTERLVYSSASTANCTTSPSTSSAIASASTFSVVVPVSGPMSSASLVSPASPTQHAFATVMGNVTPDRTTLVHHQNHSTATTLDDKEKNKRKRQSATSTSSALSMGDQQHRRPTVHRTKSQPSMRSKSPSALLKAFVTRASTPPVPPLPLSPPPVPPMPVTSTSTSTKCSRASSSMSISSSSTSSPELPTTPPTPLVIDTQTAAAATSRLPTIDKLVSPSFWDLTLDEAPSSLQEWQSRAEREAPDDDRGEDNVAMVVVPSSPLTPTTPPPLLSFQMPPSSCASLQVAHEKKTSDLIKLKVVYDLDNIVLLQVPRTIRLPELRARILHKFGEMASDLPVDFKLVFFNPAHHHHDRGPQSSSAAYSTYAHLDTRTIIRTQDDLLHAMTQWHGLTKISVRCVVN